MRTSAPATRRRTRSRLVGLGPGWREEPTKVGGVSLARVHRLLPACEREGIDSPIKIDRRFLPPVGHYQCLQPERFAPVIEERDALPSELAQTRQAGAGPPCARCRHESCPGNALPAPQCTDCQRTLRASRARAASRTAPSPSNASSAERSRVWSVTTRDSCSLALAA